MEADSRAVVLLRAHQASHIQPLVVVFCCERFELLRMTLPRIVNATRRIGGYLWAIDDASDDDRVPRMLASWKEKGYLDWLTLGKQRRFIDWIDWNLERRSVVIRYLYRHKAPFAFLVESDVMMGKSVLSDMLERAIKVLDVKPNVYAFSGSHGNTTVFNYPPQQIADFECRFLGPGLSQQVVLFPFYPMHFVNSKRPLREIRYFSLNEYAVVAHQQGLTSCVFMQMETQHLGVGFVGSLSSYLEPTWEIVNYTDAQKTSFVQVPGFDVDTFMDIAGKTMINVQQFSRKDAQRQCIDLPSEVTPWFEQYLNDQPSFIERLNDAQPIL